MRSAPQVSVIVPTFNRGRVAVGAVASVLRQGLDGVEVVVVDDGSTDDTPQVLAGLASETHSVRVLRQENRGLAAARNRGLAASRGEWVLFLDDDDLLGERALAELLAGARGMESPVVACGAWAFEAPPVPVDPEDLWSGRGRWPVRVLFDERLPARVGGLELFLAPRFPPCGVLARRELVAGAGGFDESLSAAEDYDLWFRIVDVVGAIPTVTQRLVWYRVHSGQMSSDLYRMATETARVLERVRRRHPWLGRRKDARSRLAAVYQEAAYAALLDGKPGAAALAARGLRRWPLRAKLWAYLLAAAHPGLYRAARRLRAEQGP